jgi:hypothetical protein
VSDERIPAPWEMRAEATSECLALRGVLGQLERPDGEPTLVVTTQALIDRGAFSQEELDAKMDEVRARFNAR